MCASLSPNKADKLMLLKRSTEKDSSSINKLKQLSKTRLAFCKLLDFCRVNLLIFFLVTWTQWKTRIVWDIKDLLLLELNLCLTNREHSILSSSNLRCKLVVSSQFNRFLLPKCHKTTSQSMDSSSQSTVCLKLALSNQQWWCRWVLRMVCLSLPWLQPKLPSTSPCKSILYSWRVWLTLPSSRIPLSVIDVSSSELWSLTTLLVSHQKFMLPKSLVWSLSCPMNSWKVQFRVSTP